MRAPRLLRGPRMRRLRRRMTILRRTGRFRPDHIPLERSGRMIFVDTSDPRGWAIVTGLGRGHQPAVIALWAAAVEIVSPCVAVDVGTNYGEILLSARYGEGSRAFAFEPNPKVARLLRRSIAEHPDRERIGLHEALVGAGNGGTDALLVDPAWSGSAGSSLDRPRGRHALVRVEAPVRTIDAVLAEADALSAGPLVVKIDVEGSEESVLVGMASTLDRASEVIAIVEFDSDNLRRAGSDPVEVLQRLAGIGPCWAVHWDGTMEVATTVPGEAVDMLVLSNPDRLGQLHDALAP